ncbi:MAG: ABC transporter permease [Bryobacteraceae bacterium]|nr:ABC transporter permease [Bryobacteraceae bacterium]
MLARYSEIEVREQGAALRVTGQVQVSARLPCIGWQIYDPETGLFITEGEWQPLAAGGGPIDLTLRFPAENGAYRVFVSPLDPDKGWLYSRGAAVLVVDAEVEGDRVLLRRSRITTLRRLRWANPGPSLRKLFTEPFAELSANAGLIRSLVSREILARYRGSFGDVAWTLLHPLLLMLTYFFVFGVVLETRFGADPTRTGFALYFLAGMLPWLAFSEPLTRAPYVILENRNFVKKLVFPVSILPVNAVVAGLVTSLLATLLFLLALAVIRGGVPWTAALLPLWIAPLFLFTLGLSWMLAATGVFLRDLTHIIGFLVTLWFFITPICYPEASLPPALAPALLKNPMFQFVRAYRLLLLEGQIPAWSAFAKLWLLAAGVFLLGYAWFARLKKTFADAL